MVPVVSRKVIEDHAAGMGPHRPGFPERLSEVRVERLDQEAGRVPPREGELQGE